MALEKIQVPDLGSDEAVEVIEVLVKAGDTISENDSLVVLESDKAAMEVPSPKSGIVKEVLVKVGDQVKNGTDLLTVESAGSSKPDAKAAATAEKPAAKAAEEKPAAEKPAAKAAAAEPAAAKAAAALATSSVQTIKVPDLGDVSDVDVIEVLVKVGDVIEAESGLVTLETDKAAMEVPSPVAGKVVAVKVKVGDKVEQGSVLIDIETTAVAADKEAAPAAEPAAKTGRLQRRQKLRLRNLRHRQLPQQ